MSAASPLEALFADSIPLRLKNDFSSLGPLSRTISADESAAYVEFARLDGLFQKGENLKAKRVSKSGAFLSGGEGYAAAKSLKEAESAVTAALAELKSKEALPVTLDRDGEKRIEIAQAASSSLFAASSRYPSGAASVNDLDILVGGRLSSQDEYLLVEAWAYHRFLKREIFYFSDVAGQDDMDALISEAGTSLAASLSGRALAGILVKTDPDGADVMVDGRYAGRSPLELGGLQPGEYSIRVEAQGYAAQERELSVEKGGRAELSLHLDPAVARTTMVDSTPSGAKVYKGAEFKGLTPLDLAEPGTLTSNRARMEGYEDSIFISGDRPRESVSLPLLELQPDGVGRTKKTRDTFYSRNAYLMASLPVTVISTGMLVQTFTSMSENDTQLASSRISAATHDAADQALKGKLPVLLPVCGASLALSGWFLVDAIIWLDAYLKAAGR
jgi:hypothetical protein